MQERFEIALGAFRFCAGSSGTEAYRKERGWLRFQRVAVPPNQCSKVPAMSAVMNRAADDADIKAAVDYMIQQVK